MSTQNVIKAVPAAIHKFVTTKLGRRPTLQAVIDLTYIREKRESF